MRSSPATSPTSTPPAIAPLDLEPLSSTGESALPLACPTPGQMQAPTIHAGGALVFDDSSTQVGADGNAVNLEQEMGKLDANRVRYEVSTELVSRRFAMLKYAAGDGVG